MFLEHTRTDIKTTIQRFFCRFFFKEVSYAHQGCVYLIHTNCIDLIQTNYFKLGAFIYAHILACLTMSVPQYFL